MYNALLVEDDKDLSIITQMNLTHANYQVDAAFTCQQALDFLAGKEYDLILLDVVLPDKRGDELCKIIRDACTCPIVFMSCLDDSKTIVKALRSGGDDYMVKPISYDELLARADAVIRRSKNIRGNDKRGFHQFKQFTVDTVRHRVLKGEEEICLSSIEYEILKYMVEHPDELLLYRQIYENVWDSDSLGDVRTVMVHISNLRKKLDPERTGIIETVRGAGYIFTNI
ncbi:MAG: response regulator transcription factor [Clostridiales bacterium]|nr:response regulator transcription factor [Clostridiales bacterium]